MIIFYGTKSFKKVMKQFGNYQCMQCNNIGPWNLVRVTTWFTLFFIPIFPFSFKYYVECPVCKSANKIKKDMYKQIMQPNYPYIINDQNQYNTQTQQQYAAQQQYAVPQNQYPIQQQYTPQQQYMPQDQYAAQQQQYVPQDQYAAQQQQYVPQDQYTEQ